MSFGHSGYDNLPKHEYGNSNGRMDDDRPREFFHDKDCFGPDYKRRVVFLDGENGLPFGFWLHAHYHRTNQRWVKEVCLTKNNLGDYCPVCAHIIDHEDKKTGGLNKTGVVTSKNLLPSYVGVFSILVMGIPERFTDNTGVHWRIKPSVRKYKDKEYLSAFERKMLILKHGSEKRPGMLQTLAGLLNTEFGTEHPNFLGVVADTIRTGKQDESIGDQWTLPTHRDQPIKLRPDQFHKYLIRMGMPDNFDLTQLEPFNHQKIWVPKTVKELQEVVDSVYGGVKASGVEYGAGYGSPVENSAWRNQSSEQEGYDRYENVPDDDDIPF